MGSFKLKKPKKSATFETRLMFDEWMDRNIKSDADVNGVIDCIEAHNKAAMKAHARSDLSKSVFVTQCHIGTRHTIFIVTDFVNKKTIVGPPHVFTAEIHAALPKN